MFYGMQKDEIPHELLNNPHWIMWKLVDKGAGKKPAKLPYYAVDGSPRLGVQGNEEDRRKLVTYDKAVELWEKGGYEGIGYCMLPGDGDIVAVDLDGCVTYKDGEPVFDDRCKSIMELNPGYWEMSPSRTGVHGFFKGKAIRWNRGGVETYQYSQFLTWTEDIITGSDRLTKYTKIPGTEDEKSKDAPELVESWFAAGSEDDWVQAEEMLNFISPDCDNETWVKVAMCLNHTFGGRGLEMFSAWSKRAENPDKIADDAHMEATYNRMDKNGQGNPVTFGTLIILAKEGGWIRPAPDQENWRERLVYAPEGENGEPEKLMKIESNLELILKFDEKLPTPAYNELGHKHEMRGEIPWRKRDITVWQPVRDDFAALRRYINETYKVNFSLDVIETIFNLCAIDNSYSPVVDYLEDMQGTWDGVERADTWLIDFLGTEDNAYYREAGRLVLDAAVTRAIYPGCKFDYVTIIEGPQGTGKSTLLEVLAKGHFTSDETTLEGKDALAKLSRYWFIEMCEMSGLKFADVNKLKAVITRSEDSYRPPYEKKIIDVKRSSIFMGTTNDSEYLKDSSGNRRYLPIRQGQGDIDIKGLKKVVDQIWAEVMHNHNKDMCYKLYLSRESEALVAEMRSSRTYEDPDLPEIINYISTPIPKNFYEGGDMSEELMVRENVTSKEISEQVLGIKWSQLPQKDRTRVNGLLKSIAFLNRSEAPKQFGRYGLFRYYAIDHMAMLMDFPKFYKKSQDLDNKEALLSVKECF